MFYVILLGFNFFIGGINNRNRYQDPLFYIGVTIISTLVFLLLFQLLIKWSTKRQEKEKEVYLHKIKSAPINDNLRNKMTIEEAIDLFKWKKIRVISKQPLIFEGKMAQNSKNGFFRKFKITVIAPTKAKIQATLTVSVPFAILLYRLEKSPMKPTQYKSQNNTLLENCYRVEKFPSKLYEIIKKHDNGILFHKLLALSQYLEFISLHDNIFEAVITNGKTFVHLHSFVNDFIELIQMQFRELLPATAILCYNCGDIFEPLEERCDKCGAPRPRCVVCLLDLKPEEHNNVVKLPCCGVYAHREHIMEWLQTHHTCPVCHKPLIRWLNTLKQ